MLCEMGLGVLAELSDIIYRFVYLGSQRRALAEMSLVTMANGEGGRGGTVEEGLVGSAVVGGRSDSKGVFNTMSDKAEHGIRSTDVICFWL